MRPVASWVLSVSLLASCLALACSSHSSRVNGVGDLRFSAEEPFFATIEWTTQTLLDVTGINGVVTITGVSGADALTVSALRKVKSDTQADANARLAGLRVEMDSTATGFGVRTDQPSDTEGRTYTVDYTITAPRELVLSVTNPNGDVTVQAFDDDVTLTVINGVIQAYDIGGDAHLTVGNGQVIMTSALAADGTFDLRATNGSIELNVPTPTNAGVMGSWTNGSMSVVNLSLANEVRTSSSLTGMLGNGDGTILLTIVNGTIVLAGTV